MVVDGEKTRNNGFILSWKKGPHIKGRRIKDPIFDLNRTIVMKFSLFSDKGNAYVS